MSRHVLSQHIRQFAVSVLDSVTFINNNVVPFKFSKVRFVQHNVFVRCEQDIEFGSDDFFLVSLFSCLRFSFVNYNIDCWSPFVEFDGPIAESSN